YLIVDEADKVFLKRNYDDDKGNLYKADDKGAYLNDTVVSAAYKLETNTTVNDKSDLARLLKAIHNTPDNVVVDSISKYLNLSTFLKFLAVEMYINKRDAFYDSGHNYFLYHNADNRFEYFTWDLDYAFNTLDPYSISFRSQNGPMTHKFIIKILTVPALRNMYFSTVCDLLNSSASNKVRLLGLVNNTENFLISNSLSFSDSRSEFTLPRMRDYITNRYDAISAELSAGGHCRISSNENSIDRGVSLAIFPNPVNDVLTLSSNNSNILLVELSDLAGRKILQQKWIDASENFLSLSDQKPGMYIIKFVNKDGTEVYERVIKQ
ncbi:MAG TPA: CotH kinase family protein, partial [Cytophagaceae bacterium]